MVRAQVQQLRQLQALITPLGPPVAVPPHFPAETVAWYQALLGSRPAHLETMIAELEALEPSRAQVGAARGAGFGDLPVRVVSHGVAQVAPVMPDEGNRAYEAAWLQNPLTFNQKGAIMEGVQAA